MSDLSTSGALDAAALMARALELHRAGDVAAADEAYRAVIAAMPGLADAHYRHARLLLGMGRNADALAASERASELVPGEARVLSTRATALRALGRNQEALEAWTAAATRDPGLVEAHFGRGIVLRALGDAVAAVEAYRRTVALWPAHADAHYNLGNLLLSLGRVDEAESAFRLAAEARPGFADAHFNRALALRRLGRLNAAAEAMDAAIALKPEFELRARIELSGLLRDLGRNEQAAATLTEAVQANPDSAPACVALGTAMKHLGRAEEARAWYRRALIIDPERLAARFAHAQAQFEIVYADGDAIERARTAYAAELASLAHTIRLTDDREIRAAAGAVASYPPFFLAYQGRDDRELQSVYGGLLHRVMSARFPELASAPERPAAEPDGRIRVGFASANFRDHSVWKLFRGWIQGLDRRRFMVRGYGMGQGRGMVASRIRGLFDSFVDSRGTEAMGQAIRADRLHVLVHLDLGMDPESLRLAALRLAPAQAVAWGHPVTTGLPTIDHFLSSALMEPDLGERHYSETLVRLPGLSIAYAPLGTQPAPLDPAWIARDEGAVLFACCQSLFKYRPDHDAVLARIAEAVPGARFLFLEYPGAPTVSQAFLRRLGAAFAARGLDSGRHLRLLPRLAAGQFAAYLAACDVYLDSLEWSGGNTTLEAVERGLPVVTTPGAFMRGRHSAGILRQMGVETTLAADADAYVALAVRLGRDSGFREEQRAAVAARRERLYRDRQAIAGLEQYLLAAAEGGTP